MVWGKGYSSQTSNGVTGVAAIAAGLGHIVTRKANGTAASWGNNAYGQAIVPSGLAGVTDITGGYYHTLVLTTNRLPVLAPIGNYTITENDTLTFTASGMDPDGSALSYSLGSGAPATASIHTTTGTFHWTPDETHGGASYNVPIRVQDTATPPAEDIETITITVVETNNAPTINGTPEVNIVEDSSYSFTPSVSDTDLPQQILRFSIENKPSWAAFDEHTGQLSGSPTNSDVWTTDGVRIQVSDGTVTTSLPAFSLTVRNANDAPSFTSLPVMAATEDIPYTYMVQAHDIDEETTLTITTSPLPTWLTFTDHGAGRATLSGTPGNDDVGPYAITLHINDGMVTTEQRFTITVDTVNDAPTISMIPHAVVTSGASMSPIPFTVRDHDHDANTLSVTAHSSNTVLVPQSGIALGGTDTLRTITLTPTRGAVGKTTITITVSDGDMEVTTTFTLTIEQFKVYVPLIKR